MNPEITDAFDEDVALTVTGEISPVVETPPGEPSLPPAPAPAPAATAAAKKPSMLFLVGSLAAGNYISLGLQMVGGLLQAKCVTPAVLGLFNSIGLIQGYIPFLQLGVLNGLNRELPYFIGKGDHGRVKELAAAAQAWALMLGTAAGLALFGVAGWQLAHDRFDQAAGWAANAILAVSLFYNTYYLQMTYRTSHDFARLALASVVTNAAALAMVALVALLSFYGLCLRAVLTVVVSTAILHYWRPVRIGPTWNFRQFRHLLVIGLPIFITGQLYVWWVTLNSTMVLHYAGKKGVGLYAIVLMATTALDALPLAVLQVTYPRMAEQYGKTENVRDIIRIAWKPTVLATIVMVPTVIVGGWLVEPVVRWLLPNYVDAIAAARWGLLIPILSCLQPINHVFNVVRRQDLYLAALLVGMASYVGSLLWLIHTGGVSLVAFPQAMLIGRAVFVLLCYAFVAYLSWRDRARGR